MSTYKVIDIAGTSAGLIWIRQNCKRISESKAREIHPQMFNFLKD